MSKVEKYLNIYRSIKHKDCKSAEPVAKLIMESLFWAMTDEEQEILKYKLKELRKNEQR